MGQLLWNLSEFLSITTLLHTQEPRLSVQMDRLFSLWMSSWGPWHGTFGHRQPLRKGEWASFSRKKTLIVLTFSIWWGERYCQARPSNAFGSIQCWEELWLAGRTPELTLTPSINSGGKAWEVGCCRDEQGPKFPSDLGVCLLGSLHCSELEHSWAKPDFLAEAEGFLQRVARAPIHQTAKFAGFVVWNSLTLHSTFNGHCRLLVWKISNHSGCIEAKRE